MKPPCEVVVIKILPTLRAALVRYLINEHKLKQTEVAKLLGITQSSVSQYITETRAKDQKLLKAFPQIDEYARKMSSKIAAGEEDASLLMFCEACMSLRGTKEFCRHHRNWSQLAKCEICFK